MSLLVYSNNASSVLAGAITSGATSLEVADGSAFPAPTGGASFLLTLAEVDGNGNESAWEIVKVSARVGNVMTIARGKEGTTARAWADATRCELRLTSGALNAIGTPIDATYTYTDGVLTGIAETLPSGTRTTTMNYTDGVLTSMAVVHAGVTLTTTYTYTDGVLTGMTTAET